MKKWQCTVCGYIHTGDEPPEKCPVCGADRSKFTEIEAKDVQPESDAQKAGKKTGNPISRLYDMITEQMVENHLHPISVHVPNGVIPAAVIFILLTVVFQIANFEAAAFYNLVFVLFAMPMVLFSGFIEWKKRYNGNMSSVFLTKMICGAVVFITGIILVLWRIAVPDVATSSFAIRGVYIFIHLIMLGAAGIAGHLGGELVFNKDRGEMICK